MPAVILRVCYDGDDFGEKQIFTPTIKEKKVGADGLIEKEKEEDQILARVKRKIERDSDKYR